VKSSEFTFPVQLPKYQGRPFVMRRRLFTNLDLAGFMVGAIALVLGMATPAPAQTPTVTTITTFPALTTYVNLIPDPSGTFYGVTGGGNVNLCETMGCGTIFELAPSGGGLWTQTTLHTFTGADGAFPAAGIILDSRGNIYGTTSNGGASENCLGYGCGVVFELSRGSSGAWTESVLYSFSGGEDGSNPTTLALAPSGALVGTTVHGGNLSNCGGSGCGVLFELSRASGATWQEKVLFAFAGETSGQNPLGIAVDSSGAIFGTASGGIVQDACGGIYCGVVFEFTHGSSGWHESVVHTFRGPDGANVNPSLTFDGAGSVYGTTQWGGQGCSNPGCGVVFKLSPKNGAWTEAILHSFGDQADGGFPTDGLVFDGKGNIYGGTSNGSDITGCNPFVYGACGQIFKLSPDLGTWQISAEYPVPGWYTPVGDLLVDASGTVYGAACDEYYFSGGNAFEIEP
jgi:uncharacterized repeat protein (TIGR03803 family)